MARRAPSQLYYGGGFHPPRGGESWTVRSPETDAEVGTAARAQAVDVEAAVDAAREAFPLWRAMAPAQRERLLWSVADAIERQSERFVDLLIDEGGATVSKAQDEVRAAAVFFRAAAGETRRLYGDTFPGDQPDRLCLVMREPLGVVAVISPFNAPLSLLAKMMAFPLAAGNTVVVKPSELTPLVAMELMEVAGSLGFPPGVLNAVTGFGSECGEPLVRHPGVQAIAFTGSTAVGQRIGRTAMDRLCRVQLELGGKNSLVVFGDMDPEKAATVATRGAFYHAGQICMAPSRLLVERPKAAAFAEALVAQASRLSLGDLRDPTTAYGPLINDSAVAKVQRQVDEAVALGVRVLTGGSLLRGRRYRPTVLWNPPTHSLAFREETFGPLVSIVPFENLDEAVRLANDTEYGLSAGVLTHDMAKAMETARRLRTGAVHIGSHSFHTGALAPVGGVGASGLGRSGGKYSIEEFTELKWITLPQGG